MQVETRGPGMARVWPPSSFRDIDPCCRSATDCRARLILLPEAERGLLGGPRGESIGRRWVSREFGKEQGGALNLETAKAFHTDFTSVRLCG